MIQKVRQLGFSYREPTALLKSENTFRIILDFWWYNSKTGEISTRDINWHNDYQRFSVKVSLQKDCQRTFSGGETMTSVLRFTWNQDKHKPTMLDQMLQNSTEDLFLLNELSALQTANKPFSFNKLSGLDGKSHSHAPAHTI